MPTWEKRKLLDKGHCLVNAEHHHTLEPLTEEIHKGYLAAGFTISRFCQREGTRVVSGRPYLPYEEPKIVIEYEWAPVQPIIADMVIVTSTFMTARAQLRENLSDQDMFAQGWTFEPLLRGWSRLCG